MPFQVPPPADRAEVGLYGVSPASTPVISGPVAVDYSREADSIVMQHAQRAHIGGAQCAAALEYAFHQVARSH